MTNTRVQQIDHEIEATKLRLNRLRAERRIAFLGAREREIVEGPSNDRARRLPSFPSLPAGEGRP